MKQTKDFLPAWVLLGAVVLAFCAGILNTTALMGFTHVSASHVTGNVSAMSVAILSGDWTNAKLFLMSIFSFWLGSVLSGMIIGSSELNITRHYGYAMYLEVVLLGLSLALYLNNNEYGQMMIAMACGLQNSMVATYGGAVVRTTHLTGTTSDLGATVGNWLVGRKVSLSKVILHSGLWWAFFFGGFLAVVLYRQMGYLSMTVPMGIILVAAISYTRMDKWYNAAQRAALRQRLFRKKHR
ncbi:YoaK family protein [Moraxella sp.]|uniref:YoaK family protein n=1 Tax=Moraxella sp. TaxID=479 RepID=UPI0026DD5906|nr:YoaK family protein [Moraxella sp.]MDO4894394.1 YoaK family protein [Moraxella sp.]